MTSFKIGYKNSFNGIDLRQITGQPGTITTVQTMVSLSVDDVLYLELTVNRSEQMGKLRQVQFMAIYVTNLT